MPITDYFKKQITSWTNAHWVFTQAIKGMYELHNPNPFDTSKTLSDYLTQTSEIQGLIKDLIAQGARGRVLGAGWSFSKVAATEGYMLASQYLKTWFYLDPPYVLPGNKSENFFFFQCGMSIHDAQMALAQLNKTLPVSGSSCGQSFVGAFTTGTHGSAFNGGGVGMGALQDAVRGLHVIVGPDRHVWLGLQSNPIVTDLFVNKLGIKKEDFLLDDDLFYSALNHLGGFGVIHGTLVEATDSFYLDASRYYADLNSLEKAMTEFDFTGIDLKGATPETLYHFEVMNNIYADDKTKTAVVTVMHKTKLNNNPIQNALDPSGEELVTTMAQLTGVAPMLVGPIVNTFFANHYPPINNQTGTLVDQNPYITNVGPGSIVCSIGMDMKNCFQAMRICQTLNNANIPVWYEMRYVPKVKGVLAFQRFDRTCVFEIAGLGCDRVLKYINDALVEFETNKIQFTFHWGKYLPVGPEETKYGYPVDAFNFKLDGAKLVELYKDGARDNVAVWKAQRKKLFGGDPRLMDFFSNDLMKKLGIAD